MSLTIRRVMPDEIGLMEALSTMFGEVFDEMSTYTGKRPSAAYLRRLLGGEHFFAVVAMDGDAVVGGLAAYELKKFEQERSEMHLYDLGVTAAYRRRGLATGLIEELKRIAAERGAYLIFVQADTGVEDEPAIALYTKLGTRAEVLHFDIEVGRGDGGAG